jgi:hypothetical protein
VEIIYRITVHFALEYAIREVVENQEEMKMNGTHQLVVFLDDPNLLDENMRITQKNRCIISRW